MSGIDTAEYPRDTLSSIVVGLYAWVLAASFGAAVLDVVYAKTIAGVVDAAQTVRIFSEVSDFLLLPLVLATIAAVSALAFAFNARPARTLIVASVAMMFAPILLHVLLGPLLTESSVGTWLRLVGGGSASALAIAGLERLHRPA